MLPFSGYKTIPLKSSLNKLTCANSSEASEKRAIHVKLKSWLRPLGLTVPYLKINHISCFFRYSWSAWPAFKIRNIIEHSPYHIKEPLGIVYMRQPSLLLRPVINITTFYAFGCRQVGNFTGDDESWNMTGAEELHQQEKRTRLGLVIYTDSSNEIVVKLGVNEVPAGDGHSLGTRVTLRVFLHEVVLAPKQTWGPLTRVFDDV